MKIIKVLLISIISVIILAFCIEGLTYCIYSHKLIKEGYRFENNDKPPYPVNIKTFSNYYERRKADESFYTVVGSEYKNKPILLFGDVYANSIDMPEEKSLAKKIADSTKSPVYNFARAGWGMQYMYYFLKNEEQMSGIKDVRAIIYLHNVYENDRLHSIVTYPHHNYLNLKYKLVDDSIVEVIPEFLYAYNSYFIRCIKKWYSEKQANNMSKFFYNVKLFKSLLYNSKEIAKLRYPALEKFIVLRYVPKYLSLKELSQEQGEIQSLVSNTLQDLNKNGVTIIDVTDLTDLDLSDSKYYNPDSSPKEEVFDSILPKFIETSNLNEIVLTNKKVSTNLKKKKK